MSFEVLEMLEAKIQQAAENIILLKMEIEELKEVNSSLIQEIEVKNLELAASLNERQQLMQQNVHLQEEQSVWQERLRSLLGKMDDMQ